MTLIIDASVALKWVLEEEESDAATALLTEDLLAAPDFLLVECANVLWARARRRLLRREQARAALDAIQAAPIDLRRSADYAAVSQTIAFDLNQTVYDSLYLAVAMAD